MTRLRVKAYAPQVPATPIPRFAVRAAHFLGEYCDRTPGLEVSVTGAAADAAGALLPWPAARFTPITVEDLVADPTGLTTFAGLTTGDAPTFDLLFLPHPAHSYPAGLLTPTAVPLVAYVSDLDADDGKDGDAADVRPRLMESLACSAAATVFPSAALRDAAVASYGFADARTFAIPPARSLESAPTDAERVVTELCLPLDFIVHLDGVDDGDAESLRLGLADAGIDWAVVTFEKGVGDGPVRRNAGGASAIRLSGLSEKEYRSVLSRARAVVDASVSAHPYLDTPHLDALALRKPLLCRAAGLATWSNDVVESVTLFNTTDEAVTHLKRLRDDQNVYRDRTDRGESLARSRSASDVARELFDIFRAVQAAPFASRSRRRSKPMVCREMRVLCVGGTGPEQAREASMLRSLGYEVYTAKRTSLAARPSLTSERFDDDCSTLPRWVIERLNHHDFDQPLPLELVDLINGYFGTAIVPVAGTQFIETVDKFRGRIIARTVDREHPRAPVEAWDHVGGLNDRIRAVSHRFWIAAPYAVEQGWEPDFLRGRILALPTGLSESTWRHEGRWTGDRAQLLFIAPPREAGRAGEARRVFLYNFGDLPHRIVESSETGYESQASSPRLMNDLRVLYYDDHSSRRLHDHVLQAIVQGMPVVFPAGGVLTELGGREQAGACETEADARRLIRRLLDGDRALIEAVRESQSKILAGFTRQAVRDAWTRAFADQVMATPSTPDVVPPTRWSAPTSLTALLRTLSHRRPERVGIHVGSAPQADAVREAVILGALVANRHEGRQVEIFAGRHVIDGRYAIPSHLPLRLRLLRHREYLPGYVAPRSHPANATAPDAASIPAPAEPQRTSRFVALRAIQKAGLTARIRPVWSSLLPHRKPPAGTRPTPLTFDQIRRIVERNEVTIFVDPANLLAPGHPIDNLRELPVIVWAGDMRHDFGPTEGTGSLSRHREFLLWTKIARMIVFPSEHARREAIRRYGIHETKTEVIDIPPCLPAGSAVTSEESASLRSRFGLPKEYVLTSGETGPHANSLAALEAYTVLKWRRGTVPALVLAGGEARRFVSAAGDDAYSAEVREVIREGKLVEGQDYFVLDGVSPADVPALFAGAAAYVTVAHSEPRVHGTVIQAMLARCPVVCGAVPANVERLGAGDELSLLVPPDDPAAIADAIGHLLDEPALATQRADRAHTWAERFDRRDVSGELLRVLSAATEAEPAAGATDSEIRRAA